MSVQVDVKSHGFNVDDRLYEYVTKKTGKLDRYISDLHEARVELTHAKSARQATDRHVAQITLHGKKLMLRAEERSDDIYVAFDAALDKIQRRIERYKGKKYRGRGDGVSASDVAAKEYDRAFSEDQDDTPVIVRRKKFTLLPMDEFEAIEQSELTAHEDFYIFYNMDTDSVNVLYRRRDGSLGLIDTELG
jgi:putative sigma-54 modulation protein